jgi:RNA recognition motif-containing protein
MTDPATQERRSYRSQALSEDECHTLDELGNHLVTNPFDYTSHVRFISLLQQGFAIHVNRGASPHEYELLKEVRDGRKQMDQIFPLGESLWLSWLDDEMALATNVDERLRLMDLFKRAVTDEPSSVRLWRKYGDYAYYLWATAYGVADAAAVANWSAQDIQLGKEYFKWGPMLRIWEEGVACTHFRLNDSHLVWDQYIGVLIQDHEKWPDKQKLVNIEQRFAERLAEAHATWEETYQNFGQFLSTNDPKNYEEIMSQMSRSRGAQTAWRIREKFEIAIQQAADSGNETAEYEAYTEYLNWELQKKGVFSFRMINSLYERATIRFPSVQSFWIDYIDFLISEPSTRDIPVMAVIERATRHCPWSGDLWAHRLLTMEVEGRPFDEIETIKHRATATGLLDVGGMEELMKVSVAWCGGLRRRAFAPGASEDELDIAEVAIRSALEHVKKIGHDKYGEKYAGDPHYRLERIYIKFVMQKGEVDVARDCWNEIKKDQANSYDFWYRYYMWEMVVWAKFAMRAGNEPEAQVRCPELATAVLREALEYVDTMDWPEQLVPMFLNHCEHHESVAELRRAVIKARETNRRIAKRREREAAVAQLAQKETQETQAVQVEAAAAAADDQKMVNGKRKREEEQTTPEEASTKKAKSDEPAPKDESSPVASQLRRDREHTTIIVENISIKATEGQIRHYFKDCGTIKSMKLVQEKNSQTATIEFETQEEASYSLIKSGKTFQGSELNVRFGTGCTVIITNYPPEADKAYLKNLFENCGEIVDVRMPSLKANTKRRFAYVQFLDPISASKATQLNDTMLEGKYKLVVAISDPTKAGHREGAQAEGREVFVGNVYWWAKEDEIKMLLESAGEIESVRIPRNIEGKSKGTAFVVFKSKDGAEKCVEAYNDFDFKGRKLHVEISAKKGSRTATSIHRGSTMSPTPDAAGSPSATSIMPNGHATARSTTGDPEPGARDHKERTVALMNVPDTVTAARLEQLVEQYGQIKKFTLRPDHAGAIVEFAEVASVGKAQMALEDYELEDHKLHVGTVPELMKQHAEVKEQKYTASKSKKEEKSAAKKSAPTFGAPVHRPTQNTRGRGGRRGGLGFSKRTTDAVKSNANESTGPKSNDYFRDLMAGKVVTQKDEPHKEDATELEKGRDEEKKEDAGDDLLDDIMGGDEKTNGGRDQPAPATDTEDKSTEDKSVGVPSSGDDNGNSGDGDGLLDDLMED